MPTQPLQQARKKQVKSAENLGPENAFGISVVYMKRPSPLFDKDPISTAGR